MADPNGYGSDIGCGPAGIDERFSLVEGRQALIEAILGRYETPREGLLDDPSYGLGVTAWVGKRANSAQLLAWGQALASEADLTAGPAEVYRYDGALSGLGASVDASVAANSAIAGAAGVRSWLIVAPDSAPALQGKLSVLLKTNP